MSMLGCVLLNGDSSCVGFASWCCWWCALLNSWAPVEPMASFSDPMELDVGTLIGMLPLHLAVAIFISFRTSFTTSGPKQFSYTCSQVEKLWWANKDNYKCIQTNRFSINCTLELQWLSAGGREHIDNVCVFIENIYYIGVARKPNISFGSCHVKKVKKHCFRGHYVIMICCLFYVLIVETTLSSLMRGYYKIDLLSNLMKTSCGLLLAFRYFNF